MADPKNYGSLGQTAQQEKMPVDVPSARRLSDEDCYGRALRRQQSTFALVEQDVSAPQVIVEWIKLNIMTCPPPKLYEALACAIQMREARFHKLAD
jgi:hypothetical protein